MTDAEKEAELTPEPRQGQDQRRARRTGSLTSEEREAAPKARVPSKQERLASLRAIAERRAAQPVLDDRPADEIIGYNDIGAFD